MIKFFFHVNKHWLNRMILIFIKLLNCLSSLQLFTSRQEKVETGTWQKVTRIAFQNASQNSRNCAKFNRKQLSQSLFVKKLNVFSYINPKKSPTFSEKCVFYEKHKTLIFVTFNVIKSHIFTENVIEIHQAIQKIWRFSPSILLIFLDILDFLTFPCCKETNDIRI